MNAHSLVDVQDIGHCHMPKMFCTCCDTTLLMDESVRYVMIQSLRFEAPPIPSLKAHNPPTLLDRREFFSSLCDW